MLEDGIAAATATATVPRTVPPAAIIPVIFVSRLVSILLDMNGSDAIDMDDMDMDDMDDKCGCDCDSNDRPVNADPAVSVDLLRTARRLLTRGLLTVVAAAVAAVFADLIVVIFIVVVIVMF